MLKEHTPAFSLIPISPVLTVPRTCRSIGCARNEAALAELAVAETGPHRPCVCSASAKQPADLPRLGCSGGHLKQTYARRTSLGEVALLPFTTTSLRPMSTRFSSYVMNRLFQTGLGQLKLTDREVLPLVRLGVLGSAGEPADDVGGCKERHV